MIILCQLPGTEKNLTQRETNKHTVLIDELRNSNRILSAQVFVCSMVDMLHVANGLVAARV
jgi:hypothetical protein